MHYRDMAKKKAGFVQDDFVMDYVRKLDDLKL
jgi:hypothetical protein